jgi:FixJ family two-component response regulator
MLKRGMHRVIAVTVVEQWPLERSARITSESSFMTDTDDAGQRVKQTVFVVDTDASVRESMRSLLRTLDVEVKLFESAEEFLEEFNGSQTGCLITEVSLPGMNGFQLQEQLKRERVSLPVIFLVSEGDVPMAVQAMKSGALDFIEKPYVERTLLSHIRRALNQEPKGAGTIRKP